MGWKTGKVIPNGSTTSRVWWSGFVNTPGCDYGRQRGNVNSVSHRAQWNSFTPPSSRTSTVSCTPHDGHCAVSAGSITWPFSHWYAACPLSLVFQAFWVHNIWAPHSGHGDERTSVFSIITPRGFAPRTPLHARSRGPTIPTPLA